jgi:hypothetical protein
MTEGDVGGQVPCKGTSAIRGSSYVCYNESMTRRKQRLTVTVDPDLIEAGNRAVSAGEADSLSGWVNAALSEKADRDRKLQSLSAAIADYEAEFGNITAEEIVAQRRVDREAAVVVRGRGGSGTGRAGRRVKGKGGA